MVAPLALADGMTELQKRNDFDTKDPVALRAELRRAWEDIYGAVFVEEQRAPSRWTIVALPDGGTLYAQREQAIVGREGTVRPPKNATPGDVFRVVHVATGVTITVQADDGTLVQGSAAGEAWTVPIGWAEYLYTGEAGWFRQFV